MTSSSVLKNEVDRLLAACGVQPQLHACAGQRVLVVCSPVDGTVIGAVRQHSAAELWESIGAAHEAFLKWRHVPPPRRGELIRLLGQQLRNAKTELGRLISIEAGKTLCEGVGEVQEAIDICDFAVGLSRQLYGFTIASERVEHRMMETWHPLGVCGVITSFNFPIGVWSWNAALIFACGNSMVWKPSEKAPLSALAAQALFEAAVRQFGPQAPAGLSQLVLGDRTIGEQMVADMRVPLVSATGSTAMGRQVGPSVAKRFARAILELGGNNAAIVTASADLSLALRSVAFAAMGTTGQRCTTLRRLFIHSNVYDRFVSQLKQVTDSVTIGDPLEPDTLLGPLIDQAAYRSMMRALDEARALGARVHGGERVLAAQLPEAHYVRPALVEMNKQEGPMLRETFAPILYIVKYDDFEDVLRWHNAVSAGLSSAIFTLDMREAERFMAVGGSDCGVANINIGPSGAEIGGAFGGEKETGGGREAGSDAWKGYMRRTTNTVNFGCGLPLPQGVKFPVSADEQIGARES